MLTGRQRIVISTVARTSTVGWMMSLAAVFVICTMCDPGIMVLICEGISLDGQVLWPTWYLLREEFMKTADDLALATVVLCSTGGAAHITLIYNPPPAKEDHGSSDTPPSSP